MSQYRRPEGGPVPVDRRDPSAIVNPGTIAAAGNGTRMVPDSTRAKRTRRTECTLCAESPRTMTGQRRPIPTKTKSVPTKLSLLRTDQLGSRSDSQNCAISAEPYRYLLDQEHLEPFLWTEMPNYQVGPDRS